MHACVRAACLQVGGELLPEDERLGLATVIGLAREVGLAQLLRGVEAGSGGERFAP